MKEAGKTRAQLLRELIILRAQVARLQEAGAGSERRPRAKPGAAAARLRDRKDRTREYLDIAQVMLLALNAEGEVTLINRRGCEVLGYEAEELLGRPWFEAVLPEEVRDEVKRVFQSLMTGELALAEYHENPVLTKSGERRLIGWRNSFLKDAAGRVTGTLSSGEDITDRLRMEKALRESEARSRAVLDAIPDLMFRIDRDGVFLSYKAENHDLYVSPDGFLGRKLTEVLPPEVAATGLQVLDRALRSGEVQVFEYDLAVKGETRCYEARMMASGPDEVVCLARNVTEQKRAAEERRRLESQIQYAQKLESLGVLAGGIAHDFNNLLVAVLGNADLALLDLSPASPARACVESVRDAAMRASELTQQLLAYSGKGAFLIKVLSLNELVRDIGRLLEVSISRKVTLRYDLAEGLPAVEADPSQLRQVVMNLITNASEAIGDRSGTICIRTGCVHADRDYLSLLLLNQGLPEGDYVCLEVSDTGSGMDAETRARIFDPFFTTKFTGRGLGLAAVQGIVRGHKGTILVYSEPGRGTTFKILLPSCGSAPPVEKPAPPKQEDPRRAGGTVLVVDDEEAVRQVAREILERSGFTVLTARDGLEGLEVFRQHAGGIVVVLLDLTMPRLNGEEVLRGLQEIRRDVRVILTSGYSELEATRRFAGRGLAGFVQKPFELSVLVRKVKDLLGQGGRPSS